MPKYYCDVSFVIRSTVWRPSPAGSELTLPSVPCLPPSPPACQYCDVFLSVGLFCSLLCRCGGC